MSTASDLTPSENSAARRRFARIVIFLLFGLCILFVAGYLERMSEKAAIGRQIAQLHQDIAAANVRTAQLTKELESANDDAHVAAIARDSLGLVQKDDKLLVLIDPPATPQAAPTPAYAPRTPVSTQPNWQRWLDLLVPGL